MAPQADTAEHVDTEIADADRALVSSHDDEGGLMIDIDRMQLGRHFEWSLTGMRIIGDPSLEVSGDMVKVLQIAEKSLQFAIGDFMNWASAKFGEQASQLIPETGWSETTQRIYTWVASKVPPHIRRAELTFTHHHLVAPLQSIEEQKMWLDKAVAGTDGRVWNSTELKKRMQASAREVVFNPTSPKFSVIIECESHEDVLACCRQLDALGRKYKAKEPPANSTAAATAASTAA